MKVQESSGSSNCYLDEAANFTTNFIEKYSELYIGEEDVQTDIVYILFGYDVIQPDLNSKWPHLIQNPSFRPYFSGLRCDIGRLALENQYLG